MNKAVIKIAVGVVLALAAWKVYVGGPRGATNFPTENVATARPASSADSALTQAYQTHAHGVEVEGEGTVLRVLADDSDGSRHQRFLIRLSSGQTILIAHNIDLAPRVAGLQSGAEIAFQGEYEWNERGGVVHWTHRDPSGRHKAGWIHYKGREYQ